MTCKQYEKKEKEDLNKYTWTALKRLFLHLSVDSLQETVDSPSRSSALHSYNLNSTSATDTNTILLKRV